MLRRFPLQRRIEPGGVVYRITSLDQFSTEAELFNRESYAPGLIGREVGTFIDLGCNAGWFALWLRARRPAARHQGLLVDAHPLMVAEATWHLRRNRLFDCSVVHGAVGLPPGIVTTTFHVHPTSSASSVLPYLPIKQNPVKGRIVDVTVPAISVADEWRNRFGDAYVDLIKIDIEGKEHDFAVHEAAFLRQRVRKMIVEYHRWCVSIDQLDSQLIDLGFVKRGSYQETDLAGLALYWAHTEAGH
jgi:FkbM family methyltransferase